MRATLKTLLISILLSLAGVASAAQLNPGKASGAGAVMLTESSPMTTNQGGGKTLEQAVEQVRRQYKGRIVSAKTEMNGNQEVHVIKVLTEDGTVKTVRVPGRTRN
jgi:hypothetical protein